MHAADPSPTELVRALLAVSGISPGDGETAAMTEALPASRAAVNALYTIPGIRYELPALTWSAAL